MFTQDGLFNSNELLSMRVPASLRNTFKAGYGIAVIRNFYFRRPHGSSLEPLDPKLNVLTTQPQIH